MQGPVLDLQAAQTLALPHPPLFIEEMVMKRLSMHEARYIWDMNTVFSLGAYSHFYLLR